MTTPLRLVVFGLILFFHFFGVRWGLPSKERAALLLGNSTPPESFYEKLTLSRNRLREIHGGAAPTAQEHKNGLNKGWGMDLDRMKNVAYTYDKKDLSNPLLRATGSFLIRSRLDDEANVFISLSKIDIRRGKLFGARGVNYGALYLFPMGAVLSLAHVTGVLSLVNDATYYYRHPEQMGRVLFLARLYSSLVNFLIIPAVFLLVKRLFDEKAALIAAFLWATTNFHIYVSHVIKPHLLSTAFVLFAFAYAIRILKSQEDKTSWYLLAGLFNGLGIGVGANVAPLGASVPIAWLLKHKTSIVKKEPLKKMALFLLVSGAAFLVFGHPWIFTDFPLWLQSLRECRTPLNADIRRWIWCWSNGVSLAIGWPLIILSAAGVILLILSREKTHRFLGWYTVLYWVIVNRFLTGINENFHEVRFFVPALVLMTIAAGYFLTSLHKWMPRSLATAIAVGFLLFCSLKAGGQALNYYLDGGERSFNMQAARWVNENVKPGTGIGLTYFPIPDQSPPFNFRAYKVCIGTLEDLRKNLPDHYLLFQEKSFFPRPHLPTTDEKSFFALYQEVHAFSSQILSLSVFLNPFSKANYPFWIYQKRRIT